MTWLVAFAAVALADKGARIKPADCEALDEAAFRTEVLDAQAAIERDDAVLQAQILAGIERRLPCLTFAPAPRLWADHLVGIAISEYASKGEWQTPLAAALRIRPQIDRGVGTAHPLGKWEPPAELPASAGPLPEGVALWVDGALATELPPVEGLHLVQREHEGQWVSLLLRDAPIPADWLTGEIVHPLEIVFDGQIGGGWESIGGLQDPNWGSDYIRQGGRGMGGPMVTIRGAVRLRGLTVLADARGRWPAFEPLELAWADAAVGSRIGKAYAGLGASLVAYPTFLGGDYIGSRARKALYDENVSVESPAFVPAEIAWVRTAQVAAMLAWHGAPDAKVRGGLTITSRGGSAFHMSGWWARRVASAWYVGLDASVDYAEFEQEAFPERKVTLLSGTLGLELGTRFGGTL